MIFRSLRAMVRHDGLFWRRFANLGCTYAPEWFKRYSPPWFGSAVFALVGRNRAGAAGNMQRIFGTESSLRAHWAALLMFQEFGRCFEETLESYSPRATPVRIDPPETDTVAAALEEGRGAILVTAHFGNWDIAAAELSKYGRTVNAVMGQEMNATTRDFLRAARERVGLRVIYSDSSAFSAFNMLRALRRNEIVAIQLDRNAGAEATRLVPFFGAPAPFALGPFALSRLAQAPIIPVFVPRHGRRHYSIRLGSSFRVPRHARDEGIDAVMAGVVGEFEQIVREFPRQWFQFSPFWPEVVSEPAVAPTPEEEVLDARVGA
jgi:KDO2-lipid IV(A) lauroyltransferase